MERIGDLNVVRAGDPNAARKILFVHGMWEGAWIWERHMGFFADRGYYCTALDLRGHHGSGSVDDIGKVPLAAYVQDADSVRKSLGNPILFGHSMGGLIVQKLAEMDNPPATVALAPAAPRGFIAVRSWPLAKTVGRNLINILARRPVTLTRAEANALLFNNMSAEASEVAASQLVPESGRQAFDISVAGLAVKADRVTCPLLVVVGDKDTITSAKMVQKVAARYEAEFRLYPGQAHLVMMEDGWDAIALDIASWLDAVGNTRADS